MGYESRIHFVELIKDDTEKTTFAQELAQINLGSMEESFLALFTEEINFFFCFNHGTKDNYGNLPKIGNIEEVISWFTLQTANGNLYKQIKPILCTLLAFKSVYGDNLGVLHSGY